MDAKRKAAVRFSQNSECPCDSRQSHVDPPKPIDIFNDPLYNENGTRNRNIPHDLFAVRKQKEAREKLKKKRVAHVSAITERDKEIFEGALEKLLDQRDEANAERMKNLWTLERARGRRRLSKRPDTKADGDSVKNPCSMTYPESRPRPLKLRNSFGDMECAGSEVEDEFKMDFETMRATQLSRKKSSTRGRSRSKMQQGEEEDEEEKRKREIRKARTPKNKPYVKLPPLKTKPWKPPQKVTSKIIKIVNEDGKIEFIRPPRVKPPKRFPPIVYPKVKTCKWEPPKSDVVIPAKKVVKIDYPPVKLRKTPWKPKVKKPKQKPKYQMQIPIPRHPRSTLKKMWHRFECISPQMQILHGTLSQHSKTYGFVTNGKQSAFIAATALSTLAVMPARTWTRKHLDEILQFGDLNFRRQLQRLKQCACVRPSDIYGKFYLKEAHVMVEIGASVARNVYDPLSLDEILHHMSELFSMYEGVIFVYKNQSYAIWREDFAYFILNSEDTDAHGELAAKNQGACCAIRLMSLQTILDYLTTILKATNESYEIYSFKVDDVVTIEDKLRKFTLSEKVSEKKIPRVRRKLSSEVLIKVNNFEEETAAVEEKQPAQEKVGFSAILIHQPTRPTFGDHFQSSPLDNHTFLTGEMFLTREERSEAPFVSSVAVIMLRVCKSSLWTSATISKIFQIGHSLYFDNVESVLMRRENEAMERRKLLESLAEREREEEQQPEETREQLTVAEIRERRRQRKQQRIEPMPKREEISINDLQPIVSIGKLKLVLTVERIIVGKTLSRNSSELSLQAGVDNLFKHYDHGLIVAHDVVAIWREHDYFFMFDPNRCEQFRRATEDEGTFNSCLSCFQSTAALVKLYIENLPKGERNSIFTIHKIETRDFVEKSSDWRNFKGIGSDKWILRGHISEASEEFAVSSRGSQSTCMALTALAKTRELGVMSWNAEVIDEIVRTGDEFYLACVIRLREQGRMKNAFLMLADTLKALQLEKIVVDFQCEEDVDSGPMNSTNFFKSLKDFFANDDMAVITSGDASVAVFRYLDTFYLFDSQPRDAMGRNFKSVDPINACKISGTACVLRSNCLCDLAAHFVANAEISDDSMYSIAKIEIAVRSSLDPCYFNYTPCKISQFSAMLRSIDNYHEDSEQFKNDTVEKTLCNLLSCLCFTRVLNPRNWAQGDINDIIKTGLKFFCRVVENPDAMWSLLATVEVCSVKMRVSKRDEVRGVFTKIESLLPALEEELLTEREKFQEIEQGMIEMGEMQKKNDEDGEQDNNEGAKVEEKRSSLFPQDSDELTLMEVLESFDENEEAHVILSSSLFNVAIFKMGKFYFVFDPKESNGNGRLVRRRLEDFIRRSLLEERDEFLEKLYEAGERQQRISQEEEFKELLFGRPVIFGAPTVKPSQMLIANGHRNDDSDDDDSETVMICEEGSAYVAWFTTLDLLHSHIVNKVPEKFRSESFALSYIDIADATETELIPWNNFSPITRGHWIVRGTFSQSDTAQFVHHKLQDAANCTMAIIFAKLCHDFEWNSTIVDVILTLGDRLVRKLDDVESEDLPMPVYLHPHMVDVLCEDYKSDYIVRKGEKVPLEGLKRTLETFMKENTTAGMLIAKNYRVAVWKSGGEKEEERALMMFDPHDIGPDGCRRSAGVACTQRFTSHSDLIDTFVNNVKDIKGVNSYRLVKVELVVMPYDEHQAGNCPAPPVHLSHKVKTIRGKTALRKTPLKKSMAICYAVATVCVSRSLDPEFYTPDIIDHIVKFGDQLSRECKASEEICFEDFDLNKKSSCPDQINWSIRLNDTLTTIKMDVFQRGLITKKLCPMPNLMFSLEEFFSFHSRGILVTKEFIVTIWQERCEFYIFYSCKIDKNGKIAKNGQPGLVELHSIHDLYTNIIGNLQEESGTFELRICDVKMAEQAEERNEYSDRSAMRSLLKEEVITRAVEHSSTVEIKVQPSPVPEEDDNEMAEMLAKLSKRSGKTFGFMEWSHGGFLCGRLSKKSKSLTPASRKFHSSAICVAAVAMNAVRSMNCWSGDIIDSVVMAGNSLYIESSIVSKTIECDITRLVTLLFIADREVETKVESCFEIAHEALNVEQLQATFERMISCYGAGYMKKLWNCWAVVKNARFYYLFDPLGIEVPLKKVKQHRATLYRYDCLKTLLVHLLVMMKKSSGQCIEVGGILITLRPQVPLKQPQKKAKPAIKKEVHVHEGRKSPPTMMVPDFPQSCESIVTPCCCCPVFECR